MTLYDEDAPVPARTRRSADLWALARADYLAGGSAPEVCERHGLSLSTFRYRARTEGWRRADQPETSTDEPFVLDPINDPDDWRLWAHELERPAPIEGRIEGQAPPDPRWDDEVLDLSDAFDPEASVDGVAGAYAEPQELADLAWLNAERAIRSGRMIEARGWTRIHRDLAATSRNPPQRRAAYAREDLLRTEAEMRRQRGLLDDLRVQVARAKAELEQP